MNKKISIRDVCDRFNADGNKLKTIFSQAMSGKNPDYDAPFEDEKELKAFAVLWLALLCESQRFATQDSVVEMFQSMNPIDVERFGAILIDGNEKSSFEYVDTLTRPQLKWMYKISSNKSLSTIILRAFRGLLVPESKEDLWKDI